MTVDVTNLRFDPVEDLVGCLPTQDVSCCAAPNPHCKLHCLQLQEPWKSGVNEQRSDVFSKDAIALLSNPIGDWQVMHGKLVSRTMFTKMLGELVIHVLTPLI